MTDNKNELEQTEHKTKHATVFEDYFSQQLESDLNRALIFEATEVVSQQPESVTEPHWTELSFQAMRCVVGDKLSCLIPLHTLLAFHKLDHLNHIVGTSPWVVGVASIDDRRLRLVDFQAFFSNKPTPKDNGPYYCLELEDNWALLLNQIPDIQCIQPEMVKWRDNIGARDWQLGTLYEEKSYLIDAGKLPDLFNQCN